MFTRYLIKTGRFYTSEDLERDRERIKKLSFTNSTPWQRRWSVCKHMFGLLRKGTKIE